MANASHMPNVANVEKRISTVFTVVVSPAFDSWLSVEFPFLDRCGSRISVFFRSVTEDDPFDGKMSGYLISDDAESLSVVPVEVSSSKAVASVIGKCGIENRNGELLCFADSDSELIEKIRDLVQCILFLSCIAVIDHGNTIDDASEMGMTK